MNRRQIAHRDRVKEWGRCGRPYTAHLLNDAGDGAWCGKRFDDANKIAMHVNSVSCNDCQRLASAPHSRPGERRSRSVGEIRT